MPMIRAIRRSPFEFVYHTRMLITSCDVFRLFRDSPLASRRRCAYSSRVWNSANFKE